MMDETKRQYVILGVIGIVAVLALWTIYGFAMTGKLTVTAPNDTPNNTNVSVSILRNGQETSSLSLRPGQSSTVKLRSGTVRVDASAGTIKAVDIVDIRRFYQGTTLTTPTGETKAAKQLASTTMPCPLTTTGGTYSYPCDGDGQIVQHRTNDMGTSLNRPLFDSMSFSMLQPLKGGLIGMYSSPNNPGELLFIDVDKQSITPIAMPRAIQELLKDHYPFVTVPANPASSMFALTFVNQDKTFVFSDTTDTSPTQIKMPKGTNSNSVGRTFGAEFYKDQLVMYLGVSDDVGEGDDEPDEATVAAIDKLESYILEYDAQGKLERTLTVPKESGARSFYKLTDDFYVANTPLNFTFYQRVGDSVSEIYSLADVGDWAYVDGLAYFQANGTIYKLAPGKQGTFGLHSVFSSSDITVSQIFSDGKDVLFTGFNNGSDSSGTNIYKLLDTPAKGSDAQPASQNRVEPTYLGLNGLLEYGVSADQVANLRYALSTYAAAQPSPIQTIQLTDIVPVDHDRYSDSPIDSIHFGLLLGGTPLKARLDYSALITSQLYIFAPDGRQLYDSGPITNQQPL